MDGDPVLEKHSRLDGASGVHPDRTGANGKPVHCDLLQYIPGTFRTNGFALFRASNLVFCRTLLMSEVPVSSPSLRCGFIGASSQWIPWMCQEPAPSAWSVMPAERGFSESPLTSAHRHST